MDAAFQRHDVRNGCAEKVAFTNNVTFRTPSFLRKPETILHSSAYYGEQKNGSLCRPEYSKIYSIHEQNQTGSDIPDCKNQPYCHNVNLTLDWLPRAEKTALLNT